MSAAALGLQAAVDANHATICLQNESLILMLHVSSAEPDAADPSRILFRKVHGAGNDFILVTEPRIVRDWSKLATRLCHRRFGVGADGLVVSTRISESRYVVSCHNADGSEASMCGNALRCAARCAADDYGEKALSLEMAGIAHVAYVDDSQVTVSAVVGATTNDVLTVEWEGQRLDFVSVNTGTEHVVAITESVDRVDVESIGRRVRHHTKLEPAGANVNFVQQIDECRLRIRTYERGVEAETLSCGSGAVAAAVAVRQTGTLTDGPITVDNLATSPLVIDFERGRNDLAWITGQVHVVYSGEMA